MAFDGPDLDVFLARPNFGQDARSSPDRMAAASEAVCWTFAIVAYMVFLIGVITTVTTPEDICPDTPTVV